MPRTPPDLDAILAQREWVQRLARRLVADEAAADDLVQETWLAALRNPPGRRGSIRPWLARVLRNEAFRRRRSERRRRDHEERSADASETAPSNLDLLERVDDSTRIVACVRGLRDPFREALLLRYFDQLSPPAIATRLDVPLATVRSRLTRGRAMLRERLDEAYGDRRTWCLAFIPLALPARGVRTLVLGAFAGGTVLLIAAAGMTLDWRDGARSVAPVGATPEPERESWARTTPEVTEREAPVARQPLSVVSSLTLEPIADAVLHAAPADRVLRERLARRWGPGANGILVEELGEAARTDEHGQAAWTPQGEDWLIAAEKDGHAGWTRMTAGATGAVIVLYPDPARTVRVVDEDGAPVPEAPVGVMTVVEGLRSFGWTGTTDRAGVWTVARPRTDWAPQSGSHWLALAIPAATPIAAPFDPEASEPVELVLPAGGTIAVHVTESDGSTWDEEAALRLEPHAPSLRDRRPRPAAPPVERSLAAGEDHATFEHVPPGASLRLVLHRFDREPAELELEGPAAGEVREVSLAAGPPVARWTGRLLGEDGRPITNPRLRVWIEPGSTSQAWLSRRSVELDGAFMVPLRSALEADSPVSMLLMTHGAPSETWAGRVETVAPRPAGHVGLGNVVLTRPVSLASGRVLDGAGEPLPAVRVRLLHRNGDTPWRVHPFGDTTTTASGAFDLRTAPVAGDLGLRFERRGFRTLDLPIDVAARDLQVELERWTTVSGRVLLDPDFAPRELVVQLRAADVPPAERPRWARTPAVRLDAEGGFHLDPAPPGRVELSIAQGPVALRLWVEEGVLGTEHTVDLKGRLRRVGVDLSDPGEGFALIGGRVLPIRDGELRLLTAGLPVEAEVWAPGRAPVQVVLSAGIEGVALPPWPSLPLRLADDVPLEGLRVLAVPWIPRVHVVQPDGTERAELIDVLAPRSHALESRALEVPAPEGAPSSLFWWRDGESLGLTEVEVGADEVRPPRSPR